MTNEAQVDDCETGGYVVAVWMRGDGTGHYLDCPACHFYKNSDVGPCRMIGCDGMVVKVEIARKLPDVRAGR